MRTIDRTRLRSRALTYEIIIKGSKNSIKLTWIYFIYSPIIVKQIIGGKRIEENRGCESYRGNGLLSSKIWQQRTQGQCDLIVRSLERDRENLREHGRKRPRSLGELRGFWRGESDRGREVERTYTLEDHHIRVVHVFRSLNQRVSFQIVHPTIPIKVGDVIFSPMVQIERTKMTT